MNLYKNLNDKKRIEFLINRQVELTPDNPDAYNVRAFLGLSEANRNSQVVFKLKQDKVSKQDNLMNHNLS